MGQSSGATRGAAAHPSTRLGRLHQPGGHSIQPVHHTNSAGGKQSDQPRPAHHSPLPTPTGDRHCGNSSRQHRGDGTLHQATPTQATLARTHNQAAKQLQQIPTRRKHSTQPAAHMNSRRSGGTPPTNHHHPTGGTAPTQQPQGEAKQTHRGAYHPSESSKKPQARGTLGGQTSSTTKGAAINA